MMRSGALVEASEAACTGGVPGGRPAAGKSRTPVSPARPSAAPGTGTQPSTPRHLGWQTRGRPGSGNYLVTVSVTLPEADLAKSALPG